MLQLSALMLCFALLVVCCGRSFAQDAGRVSEGGMMIVRNGTAPANKGPADYFTGNVRVDRPFRAYSPSRTSGAFVTFEPGARTAWHTHPYGQTIVLIDGYGLVQEEGGQPEEVRAGDIVWFPAGVRHWHGASPNASMTHAAIAEERDGSPVAWMEHVSDADYSVPPVNGNSRKIRITRLGSQAAIKGPESSFTGDVRVDRLFKADGEARAAGGTVAFAPGARTAWHTHPLGQTIIITEGVGLVQDWGGPVHEVRPGDIVWFPPFLKHWHGAAPASAMAHIAIAEELDGKAVDWLEQVSDAQYARLGERQKRIALIGAFTANGDLESLKTALAKGLESGLTVNQIKEVITQMYAYCGFPRALNATSTFLALMKEREHRGIEDEAGPEPTLPIIKSENGKYDQGMQTLMRLANADAPIPKGETDRFIPTIEVFLKEHLFADIFGRDNLGYLEREIATVGALSSLGGVNPMLTFHMGAAMNVGLTESQARELTALIGAEVGRKEGANAAAVLETVLERRNAR